MIDIYETMDDIAANLGISDHLYEAYDDECMFIYGVCPELHSECLVSKAQGLGYYARGHRTDDSTIILAVSLSEASLDLGIQHLTGGAE